MKKIESETGIESAQSTVLVRNRRRIISFIIVASMTAVAIPGTATQADSRTHGVIVATTTAIGGLIGSVGGPIGAAAGGVAGAAAGEYGKKIYSVLTSW